MEMAATIAPPERGSHLVEGLRHEPLARAQPRYGRRRGIAWTGMRRQLPIGHERRHGDQHHGLQQWRRPTDGDAAQLHAGSPGRPAPRQLHVPEQRHGGAPVLELLLHLARETVPDAEWHDLLSVARRSRRLLSQRRPKGGSEAKYCRRPERPRY